MDGDHGWLRVLGREGGRLAGGREGDGLVGGREGLLLRWEGGWGAGDGGSNWRGGESGTFSQ